MIVFAATDGSAAQNMQTNRATSMRHTTAVRGEHVRFPTSKLVYFPMIGKDSLRESSPLPDPDLPDLPALLQDLSFERDGYEIRVANGSDCLKRQAAKLIERMYASRGLFPYGTNADIDKRDVTVVAVRGDRAVATLTVRMDFGNGLLADTLYSKEIDAARATGGKVCEITQLALEPSSGGSHDALAGLFQALYVLTQLTRRMSDIFIEVNRGMRTSISASSGSSGSDASASARALAHQRCCCIFRWKSSNGRSFATTESSSAATVASHACCR